MRPDYNSAGKTQSPDELTASSVNQDGSQILRELQHARALWAQKRINESLRLYDQAARQHPHDSTVTLEAARAFGCRHEIQKAKSYLQSLQRQQPTDYACFLAAGTTYRTLNLFVEAEDCFRSALTVKPGDPEAHLELSKIYERTNKLPQSLDHVQRSLHANPGCFSAQLVQAQIWRRLGDYERAESSLHHLGSQAEVPSETRVSAWYQLGYLYDEQAEYDRAFAAVLKAKELQQTEAAELAVQARQEVESLRELWQQVTQADFERWQQESSSLQPEKIAFLLGAPRSGTTLLERILQAHPEITTTDEELFLPHIIFPDMLNHRDQRILSVADLNRLTPRRIKIDRERYFRYLDSILEPADSSPPSRPDRRLHVDKNPSLIRLLPAILRLFPESKILFALRDPRDIVVSCFMRQFPLNPISVEYLTVAGTVNSVVRDWELWGSIKSRLTSPWREVRYENIVSDLPNTAANVLEFLGLPFNAAVLDFHQLTGAVNSPTYEAVAKPLFQRAQGRWSHYENHLRPWLPELEPILSAYQYSP